MVALSGSGHIRSRKRLAWPESHVCQLERLSSIPSTLGPVCQWRPRRHVTLEHCPLSTIVPG